MYTHACVHAYSCACIHTHVQVSLLQASPAEWSGHEVAELLSMVARVWSVGPRTSRRVQEVLRAIANHINRSGDIVREMSSLAAAAAAAAAAGGGAGGRARGQAVTGGFGEDVWGQALAGLEACLFASLQLEAFGAEAEGSGASAHQVLGQAMQAIHTDAAVVEHVSALLVLAADVRSSAHALDVLPPAPAREGGGRGGEREGARRKGELLARLRELQHKFVQLVRPGDAGGVGGQAEGGDAGKRLLEALDRVFEPLEAGVMKLSAVSGATAAKEEDVLRGLFAVKVEAMQVVLVAAMRCPSAAAAQTLVPAMHARLELSAAEVARRLLLPKLVAVLRPVLERSVPPAVLAGGLAKAGGGNSWALHRPAGGGAGADERWGGQMLVSLRWALAHHVETRRRDARLGGLEALLGAYCQAQADRRRQVVERRAAEAAVRRQQAQTRTLQLQLGVFRWLHDHVLCAPGEAAGAAAGGELQGDGSLVRRGAVLEALAARIDEYEQVNPPPQPKALKSTGPQSTAGHPPGAE